MELASRFNSLDLFLVEKSRELDDFASATVWREKSAPMRLLVALDKESSMLKVVDDARV